MSAKVERNAMIVERYAAGESNAAIGRDLGITREWVRQIVARNATQEDHEAHTIHARERQQWYVQDALDALRRLADRLGRTPSYQEIEEDDGCPCTATYKRYFGSIQAARAEAGLDPFFRAAYSDDDLLDHLRALARQLGRTPRNADLIAHSPPSHRIYYERFGSLRWAQELAGLEPNQVGQASQRWDEAEDLLQEPI